jgi:hypothetical protein
MNKQVKNKINQINRKIKRQNKKINKSRRILQRRKKRNKNMFAAYTKNFKKQFTILSQSGNYMRVKGRDLIYKIPDKLINENNTDILTVIPSNPAYWLGTRISAIASGYQNFRPIKFNVHYVPQCAVTQQGNVIGGTLWAMAPNSDNLQQTLRTSNGGMLTQCYKPGRSIINLRRNLQFNLFRMGGKFDQESNPFIYIALTIGTIDNSQNKILPGYFYVDYIYELRNPIGDSIKYYNSGLIKNQDYKGNYINETLINCSEGTINLGTTIQKDNNKFYWHEKEVEIPNNSYVWYFSNQILTTNSGGEVPDNILDIEYTSILSIDENQEITTNTTLLIINDDSIIIQAFRPNSNTTFFPASYSANYVYVVKNPQIIDNENFNLILQDQYITIKVLSDDWTVNMVESA